RLPDAVRGDLHLEAAGTDGEGDDVASGDHARPRRRLHAPQLGPRTRRGRAPLSGSQRKRRGRTGRAAVRPLLRRDPGAGMTATTVYPFPAELAELPRDR